MLALPMTMVTAIASPKERPRPNKRAPVMPTLLVGRTTLAIISQRVDPKANIASRSSCGTARITSLEIAVMVGRIIIAKTRLAVRTPIPSDGPWKRGRKPRLFSKNWPGPTLNQGASTKRPQRPKTTLGTAASSSTVKDAGFFSQGGASSLKKMAVPIPRGPARAKASKDVIRVPKTAGIEP